MTETIAWQDEFEIKEELLQGDFERLELALFKMPNVATVFKNADLSTVRGAYLRAAIQAGWILAPKCRVLTDDKESVYVYDGADVNDMHPVKVGWLGKQIIKKHDAVMDADPKNL